jgi:hypothetical protein
VATLRRLFKSIGERHNSTVFATGNFDIPEQITAAPVDFGGGYLVSDAGTDTIYHVSPNGGTATVFSANGFSDRAGLQLSTYYNGTPMAAQYLEVGTNVGQTNGIADLINMNGTATSVVNFSNAYFEGITTATSNYGAIQSGPIP